MLHDIIFDFIKNVNLPMLFVFSISSQSVAIVASQMLLCKTTVYEKTQIHVILHPINTIKQRKKAVNPP